MPLRKLIRVFINLGLKVIILALFCSLLSLPAYAMQSIPRTPRDITPPTGSISIPGSFQSQRLELRLSARDNLGGKGLSKMQFSNNNVNWSSPEAFKAIKSWSVTQDFGFTKVYARFMDQASNWSKVYSATTFISDPKRVKGITNYDPDINHDSKVNAIDVQLVINSALGLNIGSFNADVNHDGKVDAIDVQLVINGALGINIYQPSAPTINPVTSPTNLSSQTISGTKDPDTMILATCASALVGIVNYPTQDSFNFSLTNMSDGDNTIIVKAANSYNRESVPVFTTIVYDNTPVGLVSYWSILDEHDQPLPDAGAYYNATGGDRGMLNVGDMAYSWDSKSSYTVNTVRRTGNWTSGGMWYSPAHANTDGLPLDFNAVFGPYIKPEYQGKVITLEIAINRVESATHNNNLVLKVQLKDKNKNLIGQGVINNLSSRSYPLRFNFDVSGLNPCQVNEILWVMDYAQVGDSMTIDSVRLKVAVPQLPPEEQAFLWSYAWLMGNYNSATGMVQDRSNFKFGDFENVSATAKAAKTTYYAFRKGYLTRQDAEMIITKIADTLINKIPRGPSGTNSLWPHFTKNGGTIALPPRTDENGKYYEGTEWSSGDTAFAALDIIASLQMIGDPNHQISALEDFLKAINWSDLISSDNFISHGYLYAGAKIPYLWMGFGMETMGVNWAYASATGNVPNMQIPPTDNGSGFIENVAYPIVFPGKDGWGNDWDVYRSNAANTQIGWYEAAGRNPFLKGSGLFGLSAAEVPDQEEYTVYGVGGKIVPTNDGNGEVVTLHYSGMISDIRPVESKRMWEVLRDKALALLQDKITISPLNNLESMRVDKDTGLSIIKYLKGSWNLALQAEGWALADATVKSDLTAAVANNAFLNQGYTILKTLTPTQPPLPTLRVPQDYPTIQAAIDAAKKGDIVSVSAGSTAYTENIVLNKSGIILMSPNNATLQPVDAGQPVIYCENISGDTSIIKGFTISNSYYGIKCANTVTSLTIIGNNISYNVGPIGGTGIYLENGASCTIKNNTIQYSGRGIQGVGNNNVDIIGNTIYNCRGSYGGGIILSGGQVLIKDNHISYCWDGAIALNAGTTADIINNQLYRNDSWNNGAGIIVNASTANIRNNIIYNSHSFNMGSGVGLWAADSNVNVYNNVISTNVGNSSSRGSAMYIHETNLVAKNNIIADNSGCQEAVFFEGSGTQDFSYNDLWANGPVDTTGINLGSGNLGVNPEFRAVPESTLFHLDPISQCLNAGDPASQFNDKDASRNDMGVYGGPNSL